MGALAMRMRKTPPRFLQTLICPKTPGRIRADGRATAPNTVMHQNSSAHEHRIASYQIFTVATCTVAHQHTLTLANRTEADTDTDTAW